MRPIRLLPGMLRPLTRWTRNTVGSTWASTAGSRPYIFGTAGASCETCVWIQAAAAEYATCMGLVALSILFDLSKAYEHLRFHLLAAKANTLHFPLRLLRLLVALYKMDRAVTLDGATSAPFSPWSGAVAGCSFADLTMRIFIICALDAVKAHWPSIRPAAVVDDIQLQSIGTRGEATSTAKGATRHLLRELADAKLVVNQGKLAVISNDPAAAKDVARGCPALRQARTTAARNLGIDFNAAGSRPSARVRLGRLGRAAKQVARIRWLRDMGGKVRRLVAGGLLPTGGWGACACPPPWSHVQKLRTAAHRSLCGHTAGRSATIDLAMLSDRRRPHTIDPAYPATVDPIYMLGKALWEAWLPRGWILRVLSGSASEQTKLRRPWAKVKGPISGAVACCRRIGWTTRPGTPHLVTTRAGIQLDLLDTCPRTLQHVGRRDLEAWLLRRTRDGQSYLQDLSHEPYLVPLQKLGRAKLTETWTAVHQGTCRAVVANGLWCQDRLFQAGIVDSNACQACGAVGTGWHNLHDCPAAAWYRDGFGLLDTVRQGARKRPEWILWTHGLVADPRVWLPKPAMVAGITWGHHPPGGSFEGDCYGDGAAYDGTDDVMCRAGWGVTQIAREGPAGGRIRLTGEAFGALPGLGQAVPAAEAMAFLIYLRHAGSPPHRFHTDCAWVEASFKGGRRCCTGGQHVHADIWLEIWRCLDDIGPDQVEVRKVKAHASLTDVEMGRITAADRIGNGWADEAAKKGARCHPRDEAATRRVHLTAKMATQVGKYATSFAVQFPRYGTTPKAERAERPKQERQAKEATRTGGHQISTLAGRYRCLACGRSSHALGHLANTACCPGNRRGARRHQVWIGGADGDTAFCRRCGAYSRTHSRLLRSSCRGFASASGRRELRRLVRDAWPAGWHEVDEALKEEEESEGHEHGGCLEGQPLAAHPAGGRSAPRPAEEGPPDAAGAGSQPDDRYGGGIVDWPDFDLEVPAGAERWAHFAVEIGDWPDFEIVAPAADAPHALFEPAALEPPRAGRVPVALELSASPPDDPGASSSWQ